MKYLFQIRVTIFFLIYKYFIKYPKAITDVNRNNILNKSENATLQLSIFYDNVLDKKYLRKLNNVAQTSSKRFVETPPIYLVWCLGYAPLNV